MLTGAVDGGITDGVELFQLHKCRYTEQVHQRDPARRSDTT